MSLRTVDIWTIIGMATVPAIMLWGTVSGRVQAKPWRMMVLAAGVMAIASVFQLLVAAQPAPPFPAQDIVEKLRLFEMAWIAVALAMGGALMGAAVASQAARLHAEDVKQVEAATARAVAGVIQARKALAVVRGSACPPSEARLLLDQAQRRFTLCQERLEVVQTRREQLGLERYPEWW